MNRRTKRSLMHEVSASHNEAVFEAASKRHPIFRKYPSVKKVLATMRQQSDRPYCDKDALTRAMIHERQQHPDPLWNAMLLVAYFPLLCCIRRQLVSDVVRGKDLDQLLMVVFLLVVRHFRLDRAPDRVPMRLKQATRRKVFQLLRIARKDHNRFLDLYECAKVVGGINPFEESTSDKCKEPWDPEMVALLNDVASEYEEPENLDLIVSTILRREKLKDYIARTHEYEAGETPARVHERYKRRRTRARMRLKILLGRVFRAQLAGSRGRAQRYAALSHKSPASVSEQPDSRMGG